MNLDKSFFKIFDFNMWYRLVRMGKYIEIKKYFYLEGRKIWFSVGEYLVVGSLEVDLEKNNIVIECINRWF